jgi:uncharacterized protein
LKIAGSQSLPFPPARSYAMMQDPAVLTRAIPGCESLEKIGDNEYRMKMKMVLAAVSGAFEGTVRISGQTPPSSFRLDVEGSGKIGFVKGGGVLTLSSSDTGTDVAYDGDAQIGGTLAAVGQRLVDATAKMLIKKFFEALAKEPAT